MAKGKSNAAEELDVAPDLEVVDGDATVIDQEEISALLDEMAKQNEVAEAAPEVAAETATDAPATFDADVQEAEALEPATDLEAAVPENEELEAAEPDAEPEPAAPVNGPEFTLDQVLQAASSSTGFSVDEIKNFELPEEAEDEDVENLESENLEEEDSSDEGEGANSVSHVAATEPTKCKKVGSSAEGKSRSVSPDEDEEPAGIFGHVKSLAGKVPVWAVVAAGVLAAVSGSFLFANHKANGVESKMAGKLAKMEGSVSEMSELMKLTTERLAAIDRNLSSGSAKHPVGLAIPGVKEGHNEPAPAHEEKAESKGDHQSSSEHVAAKTEELHEKEVTSAHATPATEHGEKAHPATSHEAKPESHGAVKTSDHKVAVSEHAGKMDHFNEEALTEGFVKGKLLIAKKGSGNSHSSSPIRVSGHAKSSKARAPQHSGAAHPKASHQKATHNGTSIKVYLDGKLVAH